MIQPLGAGSRYAGMLKLDHPAVLSLLQETNGNHAAGGGQAALNRVLDLLRTFRYVNSAGAESFDVLQRERRGNCLSLACLVVALLRNLGYSAEDLFVVIASRRDSYPEIVHAYAVIRTGNDNDLVVVDPDGMSRKKTSVASVFAGSVVFLVFNDRVEAAAREHQMALLRTGSATWNC